MKNGMVTIKKKPMEMGEFKEQQERGVVGKGRERGGKGFRLLLHVTRRKFN
jgi:hypothetical protein